MSGRPLQSLRLRQATVQRLRADTDLIGIGTPPLSDDAEMKRIYGRRQPATLTWPFVRVSVADEGPLRKGTEVRVTIHTFAKKQFDDQCEAMNAAVQASLEGAVLVLSGARKAFMIWIGSQVIPDASEASAWHGVNSFTATIG
jgi:hypothetical protein